VVSTVQSNNQQELAANDEKKIREDNEELENPLNFV